VRPGDVLFAYVWIPEGRDPAMIALEWHDGDTWEHRAFWGADRLRDGKVGTPSRFHAGEMPKAGGWVRLAVPAAKVALEGKVVRGVAFKMHEGQVYWGATGRAAGLIETLEVVARHPLADKGESVWEGEFPVAPKSEGRFRVELRSSDGYPSKEQKEREFRSRPDLPPAVGVDRKSVETVLAKPAAVPLGIDANDDVGLEEVRVITRPLVGGDAAVRVLWSAGTKVPPFDLRLPAVLTEVAELKTGGGLRFVVEVQDTKKQVARSDEYVIRIAADPNAADKALADLDKTQDTFIEKLAKLLGDQKKINERMAELEKEYATLDRKVQDLKDKGLTPEGKPIDPKVPVEKGSESKGLTPEELKKLAALKAELGKLAAEEAKNAAAAKTLDNELKGTIDKAVKSDLLPREIADALNKTSDLFGRMVAKELSDLGKKLSDAASGKDTPDVAGTTKDGDKAAANIESLKDRLEAIERARRDLLKGDIAKAIKALRDKLDARDVADIAKRYEKELADLKDLLDRLREGLKEAREKNDESADDVRKGADLPKAKAKREDIEKELKRLLAKAKRMLDKGMDEPEFPDDPGSGDDRDAKKVPPREEDSDEPLPKKKDKDEKKDGGKDGDDPKKGDMDDDEKMYQPRLGGPREKLDPRYAKKARPMSKMDDDEKARADSRSADAAEKALKSDSNTLADILKSLKGAQKGKASKGEDGDPMDGDAEARALAGALRKMLDGKQMKSAMQMAKGAMAQRGQRPQQTGEPRNAQEGNLDGGLPPGRTTKGELSALDPATRAMLLKLPPRLREDLLRGRATEGPEAYRAFIQDYFKRLSEKK
jgi:hypothetical protein